MVTNDYNKQCKVLKAKQTERGNTMTTLEIQAITGMGCVVYASIKVSEDYTMNEVVKAVRGQGYKAFRLNSMKVFVNI